MHKTIFGALCASLFIAACGANLDSPEPSAEAETPAPAPAPETDMASVPESLQFTAINGAPMPLSQ